MALRKPVQIHALSPYHSIRTIPFRPVGMRHHIFPPYLCLFGIHARAFQYESPIPSLMYHVMMSSQVIDQLEEQKESSAQWYELQ